jgi:hypothetical protein
MKVSQIAAIVAGSMALVTPAASQLEHSFTNCGSSSDPVKVSITFFSSCSLVLKYLTSLRKCFAIVVQVTAIELSPDYIPRGGKLLVEGNMTFGSGQGALMTHGNMLIEALLSPFLPNPVFSQSEDICLGAVGSNTCNPAFKDGAADFQQTLQIPTSVPSGVSAPLPCPIAVAVDSLSISISFVSSSRPIDGALHQSQGRR